jgi:hypothetical protein
MGLGSGIRKKPIPDPGSRGQKGTGSRIRIRNTAFKTAKKFFFIMLLFEDRYIYIIFQRQKVIKKSHKSRNQGVFFLLFLLDDRKIRIRTSY